MDEQDALNVLKGMGIPEGQTDEQLRGIWNESHAAAEGIAAPDLTPEVLDIPERHAEQLNEVSKDPLFTEAVQQKKWSFKLVEIDKLVCFQKFVYTDHVESIAKEYDFSDMAKLIDFCLTERASKRPFAVASTPQEHTIMSSIQDLRIIGPAQPIQDPVTNRTVFGFAVGWGIPFIQVAKFRNRYFLRNGYHRVYALRKKGVKHVPCILIEGEAFADVGARAGFFDETLLLSKKPPTFANFFDEHIARSVRMKPLTKILRVAATETTLPVLLPTISLEEAQKTTIVQGESEEEQIEDFNIGKEDWNVYKLSDGSILKLRQVLVKVNKNTSALPGQPNLQLQTSNLLMAVHSPARLKKKPSAKQYTPQELAAFVVEPDMKYKTQISMQVVPPEKLS